MSFMDENNPLDALSNMMAGTNNMMAKQVLVQVALNLSIVAANTNRKPETIVKLFLDTLKLLRKEKL